MSSFHPADIQDPDAFSIEDEKFARIYPSSIRSLSSLFWTPVAIAAEAAQLLVTEPGTRVLDVGCGPGKFCLVAASLTTGHFTGVEQRAPFVAAAQSAAAHLQLENVEFLHANVLDVDFTKYAAFYLFNPFEENMHGYKIDSSIQLSPALFRKYTQHVSAQLAAQPIGTRVVTYMGYADDIPACYDCESAFFGDDLKLWVKNREPDPDIERLGLRVARSYRGSRGWSAPRR